MKKRLLAALITLGAVDESPAQSRPDSVVIHVGEASKVVFTIANRDDLETLKQYDFQAVVSDLIRKLEAKDTTQLNKPAEMYVRQEQPVRPETQRDEDWDSSWRRRAEQEVTEETRNDVREEVRAEVDRPRKYYGRRTRHSFNFDLGTNNYLTGQGFPDQNNDIYTVRPWGSWYVGFNSTRRTRLSRTFFLEWGGGVSWYNFKFEDERLLISKDNAGVIFAPDTVRAFDFRKSKLTACFLNVSLVPMLDFGGNSRKAMFFDGNHSESFRFGVGPYAGYRITSYSKLEFIDGTDKRRERNHDNFYLNNIRYGLRLQVGFRDTDLFFNYDLNDLFAASKGPKLNAFSFGITF